MSKATPIIVLSSGGKDSLYMLDTLRRDPAWQVEALVTTVNETNRRVAMHGTSESLLRMQAESLGLPLNVVGLPENCDNQTYEERLAEGLQPLQAGGVATIASGDLFLKDIRHWRERSFRSMGWEPVFPIWHTPTDRLARLLTCDPWRTVITCIDSQVMPETMLGRPIDLELLAELPEGVDPCGESGEFHTFVCNGPGFDRPLEVLGGRRVLAHERYLMLDLQPT
ncbi:MAG: ATP-binding protein [Xanthomonadales bacterium]|nr:ATP-binding protein [Xanthomonadales bacterium]